MDKPKLSWTDLEMIANVIRIELDLQSSYFNAKGIIKIAKILAKIETACLRRTFPTIKTDHLEKEKSFLRSPEVARLIAMADQQTAAEKEEAKKGN